MSYTDKVEFIIRGKISENEISPSNISLSLISSFAKDINDLINSVQVGKKEEIIASIETGSFKFNTIIALSAFNILSAEINTLNQTKDFSTIQVKTASIFESWYSKSKENPDLEFEILPQNKESIKFNSNSVFLKTDENVWIQSELYLYGVITDLGGAQKPNIHLKTEDGKSVTIICTKDNLINEKENRVYHSSAIRVLASQNLYTGEIKEPRFLEFIDYNPTFNEEELLSTVEKGSNAWSDIVNHVEWVRNLRLNDE
jgi:hypothetical protein